MGKPPTASDTKREIKRRSRHGCHDCKRQKIKCDELKPTCSHCNAKGFDCDYSIKLTWGGKRVKLPQDSPPRNVTARSGQNGRVGNEFTTSRIKKLNPQNLRRSNIQPSHIHEQGNIRTVPRSPISDCPIVPQVPSTLVPPFIQSPLPMAVIVKREEGEDHFGGPVHEISPGSKLGLPIKTEPRYLSRQVTFSNLGCIPQTLSPFTSPLLNSSLLFRRLYSHFIHHTCRALVAHDDRHNPFRTILAPMALHASPPHLLTILLASSATHWANLKNESPPNNLISSLLQTAFRGLRMALADPITALQDTTLATAISLSLYNIISGDVTHWRMHLEGARSIIQSMRNSARHLHCSSHCAFLFKWFAYLDVIAGVSGLTFKEHYYESAVSLINDVIDHQEASSPGVSNVDTFTGFTSKLLSLLFRIGKLAQQKREAERQSIDISQDRGFQKRINELELDLNTAACDLIILPIDKIDAELENQSRECNRAFYLAAQLHIHRRLRNMTAEQVQPIVENLFEAIQQVPEGSNAESSLLYPTFFLGIVARGPLRVYVQRRITGMEKSGFGNVRKAKVIMREAWNMSDINVQWEDILEQSGSDISLA